MKKTISSGIITVCALVFGMAFAYAGKPFEGVITYKISYPDTKFTESQMAMFPKMMTVSVKGDKSRTEIQMSGVSTIEIRDYIEKTSVALFDLMGQKYAIKASTAEIEKKVQEEGKPSVELTSETKVIAGYTCKKAIIRMTSDGVTTTFEAFYTSELGGKNVNFDNALYKDIDGALLEFVINAQEMNMKLTATSIEKKSLPASLFVIPSDYKQISKEEFQNLFGGAGE
jgi:GLPGLI family protein